MGIQGMNVEDVYKLGAQVANDVRAKSLKDRTEDKKVEKDFWTKKTDKQTKENSQEQRSAEKVLATGTKNGVPLTGKEMEQENALYIDYLKKQLKIQSQE